MKTNPRVVFLHGHMFKNAGTSLDKILEGNFGTAFVDHRRDEPMIRDKQRYVEAYLKANTHIKALSSHHLPMPLMDTPSLEFKTIVMLRQPIIRIPSVYRFERQQKANTPGAIAAKKYGMADYIRWRLDERPGTICNYFTSYLTSNVARQHNDGRLAQAREVLENIFMVGIVESFAQSVKHMQCKINEYYPDFKVSSVRENITDARQLSEKQRELEFQYEIGSELYQRLVKRNEHDLILYQFAKKQSESESIHA